MELGLLQLSSYLVALANFAFFPHSSKGLTRGSTEGVSLINFQPDEFYYLNITSIGSDRVQDDSECGFACLEIPSCFSYNLEAFRDITDKLLCELLPSDKYNNSDKFVASPKFHHFSIPSPCSSWPCQNNGTCVSQYDKNSYVCVCMKEYKGKYCQTIIDKCTSNPCQNGGICNTLIDAFNCTCPPGFTGVHCEKDINECESNPCLNNGTCTERVNGFNCSCPPGFYGKRCETDFSINSTIMSDNVTYLLHLGEFLAPAVGNHPQWLLCYRASTHGWAASTFHNRCDGKNHTVTIIRKDKYVFGGYTDIAWESSGGYGHTTNAFIFSLRNKEGLAPFKSVVTKASYAIFRHSAYGPTFGDGHDIYIADQANSNTGSYTDFGQHGAYSVPSGVQDQYTVLAGTRNFSPDEVEVFYLG